MFEICLHAKQTFVKIAQTPVFYNYSTYLHTMFLFSIVVQGFAIRQTDNAILIDLEETVIISWRYHVFYLSVVSDVSISGVYTYYLRSSFKHKI